MKYHVILTLTIIHVAFMDGTVTFIRLIILLLWFMGIDLLARNTQEKSSKSY